MNTIVRLSGLLALLLSSTTHAGPIELFNGKDLSGWRGDKGLWKVEQGEIVGKTNGLTYNTFLIHDTMVDDFTLTFEAKLVNHNSGVQFRSSLVDTEKYVLRGYQADIAKNYWGLLYEEKARGMLDFKKDVSQLVNEGDWAKYEIIAKDRSLRITVNGTTTVEYLEKDEKAGAKSGLIGLQLHAGPPMEVRFRKIILSK